MSICSCNAEWSRVSRRNWFWRNKYARESPAWAITATLPVNATVTSVAPMPENCGLLRAARRMSALAWRMARRNSVDRSSAVTLGYSAFSLAMRAQICAVAMPLATSPAA